MLRVFAVTQVEDIGALVDENLFERDILLATKKLASSSNISERTQGENPSLFSSSYICMCEVSMLFACLLVIYRGWSKIIILSPFRPGRVIILRRKRSTHH